MLREYGEYESFEDEEGTLASRLYVINHTLKTQLGLAEEPLSIRKEATVTLVRAGGISGTLRVGKRVLEIAPKFLRSVHSARWREAVLNVLARTRGSASYTLPLAAWDSYQPASFVDHVALTFATGLREALTHGLIRLYRSAIDRGNAVRGRLLFGPDDLVLAVRAPGVMTYDLDELSADNPLNVLLVWASKTLAARTQDLRVRAAVVTATAPLAAHVSGRHPRTSSPRLPPQYGAFRVPVEIASALQRGRSARPGDDLSIRYGLLLDTHRVFEAFVERSLEIVAARHSLNARPQADVVYARPLDGDTPLRTRPDVLVRDASSRPVLVVDAKYKVPTGQERARGTASDNYQLLTSMIAHGARNGVLIYPAVAEEGWTLRRWSVSVGGEDHRLAAATVDLSTFTGSREREAFDSRLANLVARLSGTKALVA